MQRLLITLCVGLAATYAYGQSPYASTPAPPPAWGGTLPATQVPYQPTFQSPSAATTTAPVAPGSPVVISAPGSTPGGQLPPPPGYVVPGAPPAGTVWQPYAAPGAVVAPPGGSPPPFPELGGPYAAAPEPSLRDSLTPPDARDGFFQKAKLTTTWIPQLNDDSLGWTDVRVEAVTALPFFTRENPIIITPAYELHFLQGPDDYDLPARLNDLTLDLHIFRVYENHWIFDFALTPGIFADDHSFDSSDALRLNGRAVGVYAPNLNVKWLAGVAYLNGGWAKIIPIAGVAYEPSEDVKYELVYPQPRAAWRLASSPVPGRDEFWFYVKGEFQNAIWAFQDPDGTPDTVASRDWRLILGLERKIIGGISYRGEVGYVFNRDLKIANNGPGEIALDDSLLVRAGVTY